MDREWLAFAFLVATLVGGLAAFLFWSARTPFTPVQWLFYLLASMLARFLWGARGGPPIRLPRDQGMVIMCNHRSSVDPFFVQAMADRPVHWMVAREFCEHPAFSWFLMGICEVIPVNRGGSDLQATRAAIRLISRGGLVGVFPEGRINMTEGFMLPGRPGAVMMALRARVPILPCYVEGAPYDRVPWSPFRMPARVRVRCGQPIDLSEYYDSYRDKKVVAEVMLHCLRAMADLAGREDFQPQLAGRAWKPTQEELEADMAASHARLVRQARRLN